MFWSDNRVVYFSVCAALTLLVIVLAVLPMTRWASLRAVGKAAPFLLLLLALMLAVRWPGFHYPKAFEVDEAQIVAGAMALAEDPIFFRSVDGASSGPLVIYPLLLPEIFGQAPSLFSSRFLGVCITFGGVLAIYLGLRRVFDETTARLAACAGAFFFAFSNFWNYVHYNSELLVAGWCVAGSACLLLLIGGPDKTLPAVRKVACLGGFLLSLVPFTKLQSVPQALLIGALVAAMLAWRSGKFGFFRVSGSLGLLGIATLAFPVAFLLTMYATGTWDYFWGSYILNNFGYRSTGAMDYGAVVERFISGGDDLWNWLPGLLAFCAIAFIPAIMSCKRFASGFLLVFVCLSISAVALISVLMPGRPYYHYLLLLPFPVAMLAGVLLGCILTHSRSWVRTVAVTGFLLLAIVPGLWAEIRKPDSWAGAGQTWANAAPDPVSQRLIELRESPEDRLLVWGWMPYYHVYSGMVQSHRMSISTPIFSENERQTFYRKAFIDDLVNNRPRWVVDAVAPGSFNYNDRGTHGIHLFPEFEEILKRDYKQIDEIEGVRIYRLATP